MDSITLTEGLEQDMKEHILKKFEKVINSSPEEDANDYEDYENEEENEDTETVYTTESGADNTITE